MSPLLHYLQPKLSLPTPAQTEIPVGECATASANTEVTKNRAGHREGLTTVGRGRLAQLLRTRTGNRVIQIGRQIGKIA